MSEEDVFHSVSMVMNVDPAEIAKIVHDYLERGIGCDYDIFNSPPPPIYIGPVKVKSLKERLEETKMKTTSTQVIKNVNDICFSIESNPIEMESKLTVVASTNDDVFEFEFEGPELLPICKGAGLFTGWEKDQRIRELEKEIKSKNREINDLHMKWHQLEKDKERLTDRYKDLNGSFNELTKFYDKFKKEYEEKIKQLEEVNKNLKKHIQYHIDDKEMKIKALEKLKTPTIENFADEEPSSRRDILRCAEKCVCGKREQDYGTPESNFQLIADLWNQYLFKEHGAKEVFGIGPMDVSMMMALMKIARIRNGGGSGDSFVDLAGYAACGGEIWHLKKETNGDSSQETDTV